MNFSIDNISLMALTLSVGFVVDDAIVMLENIVRHMEKGEGAMEAALKGSREIGFTILSMTLSLVAVFIPVLFMGGILGRILHEFAVTISMAILISGFVSLTLTPMLCSRFLRPPGAEKHGRLYLFMERFFDGMRNGYERTLAKVLHYRRTVLLITVMLTVVTGFLFTRMPMGFLPTEDTGQIFAFTEAAQGISFDDMKAHQQQLAAIVAKDPNVDAFMSAIGASGISVANNSGRIFMRLKPRDQRKLSADEIIQELRPKMAQVPGINMFMQNLPAIRIGGSLTKSPYQFTMQSPDTGELYRYAIDFESKLRKLPQLQRGDQRPADQKPPGERGDRPGQGLCPGAHRPADRGRPLLCVRLPAGLHHLCPKQPVPGDPGTGGAVPGGPHRPCHALSAFQRRPACPSRIPWRRLPKVSAP